MELRISITRYFLQEGQYMDRVRNRVALSLGAFDESGEWKYGKKVLSALDTLAVDRETPEELEHDLTLLRYLESELELGTERTDDDLPDDNLDEIEICLQEEIQALHSSILNTRNALAQLNNNLPQPPLSDHTAKQTRNYLRPPLPPPSSSTSNNRRKNKREPNTIKSLSNHDNDDGGLAF
eukprot:CAMPEP_0197311298 /NCGR_PEP_ID=MMETSP0891-20130614/9788_1 /TAXON_ID=44058 ORGANISM="Aureoumbra lagunensis, Strain CCMP1510" /NCGR_SAMPLE_ID=MMETSP0891 /ASSEMBLY_ACC=CAM_ASM_000534 /LENGTH=180 /DNA_ID=CAMNT_0042797349 /DNA_START=139 /DNA_END=681 /DNA_ORIENTATION=+